MSTLIPLSFPEESSQTSVSSQPTGKFPYASIGAEHNHGDQPAADNGHRMQQLETMLKEVQGRAEIVEKEAYDKAYLAGEKAGMALGKRRGEQILDSIQESLKDAGAALAAIQDSFADAAMDVAGFIAKQIIADTVQSNKTTLWDIAKQAAEQLPDASTLTIAVSPDDFFAFKRLLEDSDTLAVLNSDPAVQNGTCRIISSQQDILVDPVAAVDAWLDSLGPALLPVCGQEARSEQQSNDH
jgi:flagellar biosynthesis/type III secretory pathway protein FliH